MRIEELQAYEVLEKRRIDDLNSESYILKHKKTGARVALLSNDDENKVFYIGFRTPPKDSTGVAHIIEHTVLCGSKKFPLKDPFVELVKGSLNTFLNAMTYPDKTVYPIASCNDADFQNLMHVYLDAVFYPNIYKTQNIFRQEGWHYEMEDENSELTINGVVYNEMKGAYSSADDVLSREILNSLYPDTTYGIESGGDPLCIPDLTYEEYLDFHRRYYHPSNSYIYLYGNMDMAEKLKFIDEEYLSDFDSLSIDSRVEMQPAFDQPREIHRQYSIMKDESEEDNTFLTYNCSVGTSLDRKKYVAFDILDYALCSAPGAVLKKALIDKGIGKDVYSDFNNGIQQPIFSIYARNANADQKDEFVSCIRSVLEDLVKNGIDKKALLAGINLYEFKYREADFGRFPKGLLYGLQVLDSWLYDDMKPWINIEANETFDQLKKEVETDYFEKLIQKYLLDNNHKTVLLLEPVKGLTEKQDEELKEKLQHYKESLSEEQIQTIVRETKELKEYQETPDSPEDLAKIPLLTLADMKKEADPFIYDERKVGDQTILFHDIFTNKIAYLNFVFDIKNVPTELLPYTPILKSFLGMMDTVNYSYGDLNNEIHIQTGGINGAISTYIDSKNVHEFKTTFEVSAKVLVSNMKKATELVSEIILNTKFDDKARIKEILEELKSKMQADLASSGHQTATIRALSYISRTAMISDMTNGIGCYRLVEDLCRDIDDDSKADELIDKLETLCKMIFRKENLLIDYTSEESDYELIKECVGPFVSALNTEEVEKRPFELVPEKKNEAFQTAGQVQYVCRAGSFIKDDLQYDGTLKVLQVMMGYDYLWKNIRVLGGAYGCMSGYSRNGNSYFVTYRDPNLEKSVDVFEKAADYIRNYDENDRTILQYIIGAISSLDTPKTPATKGIYGMTAYLCHSELSRIQMERDQILSTTKEKIRKMADYIDSFMKDECLCVIGTAEKIEESKELFNKVDQLIHQ
ncbi:MAG: insulinase family protein [Butyrivibrio sp.]|nr:insulinase family protein [Butyrivibrio sp.]